MPEKPIPSDIDPLNLAAWQQQFQDEVLPRLRRHAEVYFGNYRGDREKMEEIKQEAAASAWKEYLRLRIRGIDPAARFLATFVSFICRGIRNGRKVTGRWPADDVLSPMCRRQHGYLVQTLPSHDDTETLPPELFTALQDDVASPPDQAQANIDVPEWLATLDARRRRMVCDMAQGETTGDLAAKYQKSISRMSQHRKELYQDYLNFQGETDEPQR